MNGQIKYSIDFGNQNGYFSIDENTGAITLVKIIPVEAHKNLDFLLFIKATDGNEQYFVTKIYHLLHLSQFVTGLFSLFSPLGGVVSRSASTQVDIAVVADSKPQFTQNTYRGTIEEERDPGTVILKVHLDPIISDLFIHHISKYGYFQALLPI